MDRKLITSVLGFDFNIKLLDSEGNEIKKGYTTTCNIKCEELPEFLKASIRDTSWFDHHNEDLLRKIIDFRRRNA